MDYPAIYIALLIFSYCFLFCTAFSTKRSLRTNSLSFSYNGSSSTSICDSSINYIYPSSSISFNKLLISAEPY